MATHALPLETSNRSPSLFVSHGAPTLALADSPARRYLSQAATAWPRPRAIVVVSAHWETASAAVLATPRPATIHDFYGFPAPLYALEYPAPGAPALAETIVAALTRAGLSCVLETARGYDHGAWIPLLLMYPDADIPVVQVAVCPAAGNAFHWQLGAALAPLRAAGVLVIGSGALTHNLDEFRDGRGAGGGAATPPYVQDFRAWVERTLAHGDDDALRRWDELAPAAARAHPTPEHFLPLLVAAAAAGDGWHGERVHASVEFGIIAMDAYAFDGPGKTT